MKDKIFGISSPFEDVKKLDREYKRLSNSGDRKDDQDWIDHALNFSITAWHLADKVFNFPDTQRVLGKKGITDWSTFHNHIFSLCPELWICYDLAINYKHFHNKTTTVESATKVERFNISKINGVPVSQIAKINGIPVAQVSKINGISIYHEKLVVKTTDGTELDFMEIASAVNAFWQKELDSLRTCD